MRLELITESGLPLLMAWRNIEKVHAGFYSQTRPLEWNEHLSWWRSRNSDWRSFFVIYEERPVGVVNIGQLDHWSPEIGYLIGEVSLWGKGIGTQAVQLGIDWVKDYAKTHKHITHIHTTIKDNNRVSVKLITKLGFKIGMKAREGERYWQRKL